MARSWYAVQTQANRESWAVANLARQGFATLFPKTTRTVRHARRSEKRTVSFFPGYCFVRLDSERDRWRSINGTSGVIGIVMTGERPLPVPDGLIAALGKNMDQDGCFRLQQDLAVDDTVRLIDGPFDNLVATIDRLDGNHRARILLDAISNPVSLVVRRDTLMKIEQKS